MLPVFWARILQSLPLSIPTLPLSGDAPVFLACALQTLPGSIGTLPLPLFFTSV